MVRRLLLLLSFPVIVFGALACASEARVAATTSATAPVSAPSTPVAPVAAPSKPGGDVALQSVDLALDVPQTVDGMELLWTGVEDSRCPADVTCVWAGQVTVHIRVTDGGDARPLELTLGAGGDAVDSERHRLRLTAVSPYPRSTGAVERGQQRATIEIARK